MKRFERLALAGLAAFALSLSGCMLPPPGSYSYGPVYGGGAVVSPGYGYGGYGGYGYGGYGYGGYGGYGLGYANYGYSPTPYIGSSYYGGAAYAAPVGGYGMGWHCAHPGWR